MNYTMPAEWEPHFGTIMIYPERPGSWCNGGAAAKRAFGEIARHICCNEKLFIAVSPAAFGEASSVFGSEIADGKIELWEYACNDCWARDTAPTFTTNGTGIHGVDWQFNAWGGDFDGLYKDYAADDAFPQFCREKLGVPVVSAKPFVLEGGSVHSNGEGVILTTEECLLSRGRNPGLSKKDVEYRLSYFLGAKRVVWLPYGIMGDETNGHIDNMCAFSKPDEALLAWTDEGEQGRRCRVNEKILISEGFKVIRLPLPRKPVTFTDSELAGFTYEEGEIVRKKGDILAASYINFYICNAGVLAPQFGDENDKVAVGILSEAFKGRKIIPVYTRDIIVGGGNIHCLTQQIPKASAKI